MLYNCQLAVRECGGGVVSARGRRPHPSQRDHPCRGEVGDREHDLARGEYVIKCRFQSKRAQKYIRLQLFPSPFSLKLTLNNILARGEHDQRVEHHLGVRQRVPCPARRADRE